MLEFDTNIQSEKICPLIAFLSLIKYFWCNFLLYDAKDFKNRLFFSRKYHMCDVRKQHCCLFFWILVEL